MTIEKCTLVCFLISIVLGLPGFGDEAEKPFHKMPAKLEKLQAFWSAARAKAIRPIDEHYAESLKSMMFAYAKAGDIVSSLAVKRELDAFEAGADAKAPVGPKKAPAGVAAKLVKLRASWQAAREGAFVPINKTYQKALENMVQSYTSEGDIDAALLVQGELKLLLKADSSGDPSGAPVVPEEEPGVSDTLTIVKALWGTNGQHDAGEARDVTEKMRNQMKDGEISVKIVPTIFGDPKPYSTKMMVVEYKKRRSKKIRTLKISENQLLELP